MSIYISSNQENLSNFIKTGYDIIIKILKVFYISCNSNFTIFGLAVLMATLLTTPTPLWPALPITTTAFLSLLHTIEDAALPFGPLPLWGMGSAQPPFGGNERNAVVVMQEDGNAGG